MLGRKEEVSLLGDRVDDVKDRMDSYVYTHRMMQYGFANLYENHH